MALSLSKLKNDEQGFCDGCGHEFAEGEWFVDGIEPGYHLSEKRVLCWECIFKAYTIFRNQQAKEVG